MHRRLAAAAQIREHVPDRKGFELIINCPSCQSSFAFDDAPPKFCQECGQPLQDGSTTSGSVSRGATKVIQMDDVTIAPTTATPTPTRDLHAGERVDNYELQSVLGSGGMGVVWKAVDVNTGRQVALKRLSKDHLSDEESVLRFMREAQLASKMSHPRVTFVYSAGEHEGQPFIAMELMPGETLADRVKSRGPMQVGEAVDKILDVIDGLDAAHEMGLIHRDVKPSNCFIDKDDRVKIGDFGLSKSVIATEIELTRTGIFMGTPAYAAPEQIRGDDLDHRTDIYAVGATLCNLLTGSAPFTGDAMTVTAQIVTDTPKLDSDLPKELRRVIQQTLEKKPAKRHQTLKELKNALLPFAQSENSLAAIGRRVSAYMVDLVLVSSLLIFAIVVCGGVAGFHAARNEANVQDYVQEITIAGSVAGFIIPMFYFFILEGLLGKTIGKKLLGLKVVDAEGAKPSLLQSLLRAYLIPGAAAIPLVLGLILMWIWPVSMSPVENTFRQALNIAISMGPLLLILSPLIRYRGNEGWHEILSGTKVIVDRRIRKTALLLTGPQPVCASESELQLGPYRVGQILHDSDQSRVFLGVDTQLDRNVWVHQEVDGSRPSEARILLARPARQRWLDGGESDGQRWDAFEAVEGLPIQAVTCSKHDIGWPEYRKLLVDVAEELKLALADGTIPKILSLPQVWLDRNGQAKIIDRNMVDVIGECSTIAAMPEQDVRPMDNLNPYSFNHHDLDSQTGPVSPQVGATALVKSIGELLLRGQLLPLSAQDFLFELKRQPDDISTLDWVIDQLVPMEGNVGRINWETRVGVLGITVGLEYMAYTLFGSFMFMAAFFLFPLPNPSRYFVGLAMSLTLPVAMGVFFGGGIVFHLMGIAVANQKGQPVGWVKLFARSFVSWLPAMAVSGAMMMLSAFGNLQLQKSAIVPGSLIEYASDNPVVLLYVLGVVLIGTLAQAAGVVSSLVSPTRGLQDFLLRTRLLPK